MLVSPMLSLPLSSVLRRDIAHRLEQILHLSTIGAFLIAWRDPRERVLIERQFDSPSQARHAALTCAAWIGLEPRVPMVPVRAWWQTDSKRA